MVMTKSNVHLVPMIVLGKGVAEHLSLQNDLSRKGKIKGEVYGNWHVNYLRIVWINPIGMCRKHLLDMGLL